MDGMEHDKVLLNAPDYGLSVEFAATKQMTSLWDQSRLQWLERRACTAATFASMSWLVQKCSHTYLSHQAWKPSQSISWHAPLMCEAKAWLGSMPAPTVDIAGSLVIHPAPPVDVFCLISFTGSVIVQDL